MGFLSTLKAVLNRSKFTESSITTIDGLGVNGAKPWPFNYHEAVMVGMRSWPYRCILGNANMCASIPLRLYVRNRSKKELRALGYRHGEMAYESKRIGRRKLAYLTGQREVQPSSVVRHKLMQFGDEFEEVMDHPIIDLLRNANPQNNGFDLAQFRFISKQITGNAYLHPIMSQSLSRPTELWPMLPQWVWAVPGEPGGEELIKAYVYGATVEDRQRFDVDEVMAFRTGINPKSLYYGYGPTEAAWLVLGTIYARQVMDKATYDNMARPDWMLVNEQMNQDQATRLKTSIEMQLKGMKNAGKMLALGGKITPHQMNWKPNELSTEDRHLEEVAGIYGYPITKLLSNDPNRANAQTGDAGWTKDTILPMLRQDEESLNQNGLLALFGDGELADNAVLAYDDPTPANRQMDMAESKTLVLAGIRTINEDRKLRGDDPMDGGDVLRFNGRDLTAIDAPPPAPGGFDFQQNHYHIPEHKTVASKPRRLPGKRYSQAGMIYKAGPCCSKAPADQDIRDGEHERPIDRTIRNVHAAFLMAQRQVEEVIRRHGPGKAARKVKQLTEDDYDDIDRILRQMGETVTPEIVDLLRDAVISGGHEALRKIQLDPATFTTESPNVSATLRKFGEQIKTQIVGSSIDRIRATLAEGVAAGESTADLATRVREGGVFSASRAEMIARSESARAYGQGQIDAWKESGIVEGKQWLLAPEACEFCEAAAAIFEAKTIGLEEAFFKKGSMLRGSQGGVLTLDYADVDAPALHPNCRCDLIAVLSSTGEET